MLLEWWKNKHLSSSPQRTKIFCHHVQDIKEILQSQTMPPVFLTQPQLTIIHYLMQSFKNLWHRHNNNILCFVFDFAQSYSDYLLNMVIFASFTRLDIRNISTQRLLWYPWISATLTSDIQPRCRCLSQHITPCANFLWFVMHLNWEIHINSELAWGMCELALTSCD